MRLEGKVSLVTGAGSGIGRAVALAFSSEGAKVAVNDEHREECEETVRKILEQGGSAAVFVGDVADSFQVKSMVAGVVETYGRLDILVNAAGIYTASYVVEMEDGMWDRLLAVNLKGVFNCCRAAAAYMIRQGEGVIINISSIGGVTAASIQHAHYGASKAGIIGFSRTLARELGPCGVRVNVIAPGVIEGTPMGEEAKRFVGDAYLKSLPLGRWGRPEDIAWAAVFLASEESSWITGETLNVNGGAFMP